MQINSVERWQELCAQAAVKDDPERLMKLVYEIDRLLQEDEQRSSHRQKAQPRAA